MQLHRYEYSDDLVVALSTRIAGDLQAAVDARGKATLVVSGGATPKPLFAALSRLEIDWGKVLVTQVDERWVAEDHVDSNARLIREYLLQNAAGVARFISMKTAGADVFAAEAAVAEKLAPFAAAVDVTVLGMGQDGHTASFFAGAKTLGKALDPQGTQLCLAVLPPAAAHARMTFSLPALLRSKHLYLHISGASKRRVLEQALQAGAIEELPIRAILRQQKRELDVYYTPGS